MSKLPEHLQKKIDDEATSYEFATGPVGYKSGAAAMHSLMLEELRPIVEALELVNPEYSFIYDDGSEEIGEKVIEALAHYREKIEGMK